MSKLGAVIDILADGGTLPEKYKDHQLNGALRDYRECHIQPDTELTENGLFWF